MIRSHACFDGGVGAPHIYFFCPLCVRVYIFDVCPRHPAFEGRQSFLFHLFVLLGGQFVFVWT